MAERTLRPRHQDEIRTKIQTTQLIKRLENYALSDGEEEITNGRLKAIEILLKKSLPDLSAIQHSGDEDNPMQHKHTLGFEDSAADLMNSIRESSK